LALDTSHHSSRLGFNGKRQGPIRPQMRHTSSARLEDESRFYMIDGLGLAQRVFRTFPWNCPGNRGEAHRAILCF